MKNTDNTSGDKLKYLKEQVEKAHDYFQPNNDRYHEFVKFVFRTSLTTQDEAILEELGKPALEFNILESFVSRLRGEFAKQQPSLRVRAADGVPLNKLTPDFNKTLEVVEAHLRAMFFDATNDKLEYNIYSDLLAGGFSVMQVYTDYINEMSMEQNIYVDRVFDPTLCGFDPLARESHKGDGRFCFQLYPKTRKEFEEEHGKEKAETMKWSRNLEGFGWSYRDEKEEMVLVCDFYEKKRTKNTLLKLSTGETILKKDHPKFIKEWEESGNIEQLPVVTSERKNLIETIVRYRFCENEILEDAVETNFKYLPLVFVDGNSVWIKEGDTQSQMTRPYVYHAKGVQQLKNFAGQTLANELENMIQHKFIVAKESIPLGYEDAYTNIQKQNTVVYNHFLDRNSPEVTLPPPREIHRTPVPPEVTNTFRMSDEMTQVILGSYDSALGANKQEISGAAIAMGAMQANNASVPYIVGYIKGLNRIAQIMVDLIPKYYRTPRSLPILLPSGKRDYEIVNREKTPESPASIYMNYDPNSLDVVVETGVNFAMQKEMALKTMLSLMQASPRFADFMNEEGLGVLLDNIDIRGIDALKAKTEAYQEKADQKKSQMEQMQMKMNQMQQELVQAKAKAEIEKSRAEAMKTIKEAEAPTRTQVDLAELAQEGEFKAIEAKQNQAKIDLALAEFIQALKEGNVEQAMKIAQIDAENARTAVESFHTLVSAQKVASDISQDQGNNVQPEGNNLQE